MALVLITPPAVEPVDLLEAKLHLRVDGADDDALILSLIRAAREWCEHFTNRAFITQTWELWLDAWPAESVITIPLPPLQSVVSLKYLDEDGVEHTISSDDYVVDATSQPGRLALKSTAGWPSTALYPIGGVRLRFTVGYGNSANDVPECVRQAIRLLVGHWYENRENSTTANLRQIPMAAEMLLWPLRVGVIDASR